MRIAEGLEASGALGEAAIERGLETLEMFERYCKARGIDRRVREARVVREERALALRLTGDDRLARWRVGRRLPADAVRRVLGRPLIPSP